MHSTFLLLLASVASSFALPEMHLDRRTEPEPSNGTLVPSSCEWTYQGCYEEPARGRILPAFVKNDVSLTVEKCFAYCLAGNYAYALVEFGQECWCDNTANLSGGLWNGTGTGCRMACKGNKDELCGGQTKGLLYKHNPSASTCTSTCMPTTVTTTSTSISTATQATTTTSITTVTSTATSTTTTTATPVPTTITVPTTIPTTLTESFTTTETSTTTTTTGLTTVTFGSTTITETITPPTLTKSFTTTATETSTTTTTTGLLTVTFGSIIVTKTITPPALTESFTTTEISTTTTTTGVATVTFGSTTVTDTITVPTTKSVTATVTISTEVPTTVTVCTGTEGGSTVTVPTTITTTVSVTTTITVTTTTPIPTIINPQCYITTTVRNGGFENGYDSSWSLLKGGMPGGNDFGYGGRSGSRCFRSRFPRNSPLDEFQGLKQKIRLCTKTNYILKAWTKESRAKAGCVADFYVDEKIVTSSTSGTTGDWVETKSGIFQAGEEGVIELVVKMTCPGYRGGNLVEYFLDDISIIASG